MLTQYCPLVCILQTPLLKIVPNEAIAECLQEDGKHRWVVLNYIYFVTFTLVFFGEFVLLRAD